MSGYLARNPLMIDTPQFGPPPANGRPPLINPLTPAGDWRDVVAPQPTQAEAADATAKAYTDWLARDRAEQIRLGYVDPATGQLTPEGWRAQAAVIGGGFGPADVGLAGGALGLIKNYHGSPHLFAPTPKNPLGEFDPTKIGTGEGNQAFGVGAGYTGAEAVARRYRDSLSNTNPTVNHYLKLAQGDRQSALSAFDRDVSANAFGSRIHPEELAHIRTQLETPPGHMYEVNLLAEPEHYLDLDKPLSEQSAHVQDAFVRGPTLSKIMAEHDQLPTHVKTAEDWLTHMTTPRLTGMNPKVSPADLSAALEEAGIAGYRYLDAGSRGKPNDPDATHNHVTFNPEIMEIVRRFGIAGLIGGGAAATAAGGNQGQSQ